MDEPVAAGAQAVADAPIAAAVCKHCRGQVSVPMVQIRLLKEMALQDVPVSFLWRRVLEIQPVK